MRLLAALLMTALLVAPATAGDYSLANRPVVVFPGGAKHVSPYPASRRAAAIWAADGCWRDCTATCNWDMVACVGAMDSDACRPQLDACDRACQRSCRIRGGPLLGFVDW